MLVEHIVTSRLTAARRLFIDQSKSIPVSFTTVVRSRHATALFHTWKRTRCVTRLNNGSEGDKVSLFPKLICLFEDNDKKKTNYLLWFFHSWAHSQHRRWRWSIWQTFGRKDKQRGFGGHIWLAEFSWRMCMENKQANLRSCHPHVQQRRKRGLSSTRACYSTGSGFHIIQVSVSSWPGCSNMVELTLA